METNNVNLYDDYNSLVMKPVFVIAHYTLDWFQGEVLKYISRFHKIGGRHDLEKAISVANIAIRLNMSGVQIEYRNLPKSLSIYVKQFEYSFSDSISYTYFVEAVKAIMNKDYKNLSMRIIPNLIYSEYGETEL